jgi:hypothetical protein
VFPQTSTALQTALSGLRGELSSAAQRNHPSVLVASVSAPLVATGVSVSAVVTAMTAADSALSRGVTDATDAKAFFDDNARQAQGDLLSACPSPVFSSAPVAEANSALFDAALGSMASTALEMGEYENEIIFRFRTTSSDNGVLFSAVDGANYLAVFLQNNGRVHAKFSIGSAANPVQVSTADMTLPLAYNDNRWHAVMFYRNGSLAALAVDTDVFTTWALPLNASFGSFSMGGDRDLARLSLLVGEPLTFFSGCLGGVQIDGLQLSLQAMDTTVSLAPCPLALACATSPRLPTAATMAAIAATQSSIRAGVAFQATVSSQKSALLATVPTLSSVVQSALADAAVCVCVCVCGGGGGGGCCQ